MKNIVIIGTKNETEFIKRNIKNSSIYTITVVNGIETVGEYIIEMIYAYCIINAFTDGHSASLVYTILSSIDLLKDKSIHLIMTTNMHIPLMTADRVMQNPYCDEYECLILGLSHAEVGIVPEILPWKTANIAVSSQDIYYNLESLKYCIDTYPEKISRVKKVYVDMFDYTYFNFDTSLSSTALSYYASGGIFLPHNILKNVNFELNGFGNDLFDYVNSRQVEGTNENHLTIWIELFGNMLFDEPNYIGYRNKPFLEFRDKILDAHDCHDHNVMNSGIINKRHENTISENKLYLRELLELLLDINSDMEINLLITPQHQVNDICGNEQMIEWKQEFYSIIEELKQDYKFRLLDFRMDDMSSHDEYFYDAEHLNYLGAKVFTKKLLEV